MGHHWSQVWGSFRWRYPILTFLLISSVMLGKKQTQSLSLNIKMMKMINSPSLDCWNSQRRNEPQMGTQLTRETCRCSASASFSIPSSLPSLVLLKFKRIFAKLRKLTNKDCMYRTRMWNWRVGVCQLSVRPYNRYIGYQNKKQKQNSYFQHSLLVTCLISLDIKEGLKVAESKWAKDLWNLFNFHFLKKEKSASTESICGRFFSPFCSSWGERILTISQRSVDRDLTLSLEIKGTEQAGKGEVASGTRGESVFQESVKVWTCEHSPWTKCGRELHGTVFYSYPRRFFRDEWVSNSDRSLWNGSLGN